jgi:hypothetical protein
MRVSLCGGCTWALALAVPIVAHRLTKEQTMQRTATLRTPPAATPSASRWGAWLRQAWEELALDADERFLRGAHDLAELERRLRRLERGRDDRFAPLHPHA